MKWAADIAKSVERVTIAAFTTRNTIPFFLAAIVGIVAWRMPAPDLRAFLGDLLQSRFLLALGWSLFVITFFGARQLIKWQEKRHAAELDRLTKLKDLALQGQMELPLKQNPPK
jgi:hypothetical protein